MFNYRESVKQFERTCNSASTLPSNHWWWFMAVLQGRQFFQTDLLQRSISHPEIKIQLTYLYRFLQMNHLLQGSKNQNCRSRPELIFPTVMRLSLGYFYQWLLLVPCMKSKNSILCGWSTVHEKKHSICLIWFDSYCLTSQHTMSSASAFSLVVWIPSPQVKELVEMFEYLQICEVRRR